MKGSSSEEVEPRVVTADVAKIVARAVRPKDEDGGESVAVLAERAKVSTRTIYRVMKRESPDLDLDQADRLALAAGGHLSLCRIVWPDGRVEPYLSLE